MKYVIGIIQARVGSNRLPRKILLPLNGRPAIYHIMSRVMACNDLRNVYLATSKQQENDILAEMANEYGWNLYRGSENDVLSRFVDIVKKENPDIVVRINADNFAIDPHVISHGINEVMEKQLDVCSSFISNTYPFGAGAEVSTTECILRINRETKGKNNKYREHVFSYAYEHPEKYRVGFLKAPNGLCRPDINVSVDTEEDYHDMCRLYKNFKGRESSFILKDVIEKWDAIVSKQGKNN